MITLEIISDYGPVQTLILDLFSVSLILLFRYANVAMDWDSPPRPTPNTDVHQQLCYG